MQAWRLPSEPAPAHEPRRQVTSVPLLFWVTTDQALRGGLGAQSRLVHFQLHITGQVQNFPMRSKVQVGLLGTQAGQMPLVGGLVCNNKKIIKPFTYL